MIKAKMNVIVNIFTAILLITENIKCTDDNKQVSIFYKDKFLLFNSIDGTVEVYENMMIPYMTYIENVFFPAPSGIISKINLMKNGMVKFVTGDGSIWIYERFKLRYKRKKKN